jgi:hypothetical protein
MRLTERSAHKSQNCYLWEVGKCEHDKNDDHREYSAFKYDGEHRTKQRRIFLHQLGRLTVEMLTGGKIRYCLIEAVSATGTSSVTLYSQGMGKPMRHC